MSARLASGGRLLDRSRPLGFTFNGMRMRGFAGDTLASALLANDQVLVGRSFKYHRPRGIVASGPEEPNALFGVGEEGLFRPNQRATAQELFDGLRAVSQNHWPSLEYDLGALSDLASSLLPAGFYYKTFIHPRMAWKHVFEPFIRRAAGLGKAPKDHDPDTYEHFHVHVDVLVVGGGIAGLAAARQAGAAGARVLLLERSPHWGGRTVVDGAVVDGMPVERWVSRTLAELAGMDNVRMRARCVAAGVYDHGYVIGCESSVDGGLADGAPRQRLWRIRAKQVVTATGAIERPLSFACNDVPGVMLASAVRDYVVNWGVSPGDRTVLVTNNDDAYRTAITLKEAGLEVPAVIDARPQALGPLAERARDLGIRIECGKAVATVNGRGRVNGVGIAVQAGEGAVIDELACDAVAMSGGWSPAVHLWSHCGGGLMWDGINAYFRPDPTRPPVGAGGEGFVRAAGSANGAVTLAETLADADSQGRAAALAVGHDVSATTAPEAADEEVQPMLPVWLMPQGAGRKLRRKIWLDYQNDVKVSDVQLAVREGYESVEHVKRYTTLGMATDQGKLSNINGLGVISGELGVEIPKAGTTTFRPPFVPISLGAVAGEARGGLFQPVRRTPMHDWHEANGAFWEPVGRWRRPYCYRRGGEDIDGAVRREVTNTRKRLGLFDASTLGKILVRGPAAGRFLDMMYTGMISTLPPGRCRYGLMCDENGFLIDDGVVARLGEHEFLCHTTSGGADRIHAHMEEWLQTEWWDWRVYTLNLTEQFAQIAVVGPNARETLEHMGGMDLSSDALPFMSWADGSIGGFGVRVFSVSFSGETSFEIAVRATQGNGFWEAVVEAGNGFGAMPYGTEALHVMRAEKGFIMIGDETDGTVIPQDLGLHWAISRKKSDYLGKRAHERVGMTDPDRWKLVGLQTLDGSVLPDGAYAVANGKNVNGQRNVQGRVTSSYFSPTLGRGIALGLVKRGPERTGEVLEFPCSDGLIRRARVVSPAFLDAGGSEGEA